MMFDSQSELRIFAVFYGCVKETRSEFSKIPVQKWSTECPMKRWEVVGRIEISMSFSKPDVTKAVFKYVVFDLTNVLRFSLSCL